MSDIEGSGAAGEMALLAQHDPESQRIVRSVSLSASADGKSVVLNEIDVRKVGIQREHHYEITTGELITLIRAHGAELPGENHVDAPVAP
jgi:hypothetical protein